MPKIMSVTQATLKMNKIITAELERAHEGSATA